MNKHNVCNNCNKPGHMYHQCKLPITSFGIIVFRHSLDGLQFLMIRRKDSFGYIDFVRGKYLCYNINQLQQIVDEMSVDEKERIRNESFESLWVNMWGESNGMQSKGEETVSAKKFESIKNGVLIEDKLITLNDIINNSKTQWSETEWEFPKGRRNFQEKDLECALREFEEETGISSENISLVDNLIPFDEVFIGSNHKCYKHKYFLAYMNQTASETLENFQKTEVSKLEWKTIDQCISSIRPYHLEKKKLITNISSMLNQYRIFS